MDELKKELEHLGLSDKEAKVYLAALEMGPSPVQDISHKAHVNRATTYVMIESLAAVMALRAASLASGLPLSKSR